MRKAGGDDVYASRRLSFAVFDRSFLFGLKTRLAVRALDEFFLAADRDRRDDEKQRDEIHPGLFGKLRERAALRAADHFVGLFRTPVEKFGADDEEHMFLNYVWKR